MVHHVAKRSIKLTQLEFDAVIAAVEFDRRAMLAVEDQAAADVRLVLLEVLRSEWGHNSPKRGASGRRSPPGVAPSLKSVH